MNLYEILHVSQDAPEEIIKLAYKGLAQKYHPDRYKGNDANEIMVKIREAYETLIDPEKRKNYDTFLAEQARRKQQQEEYVKRQQQEEFIRSQRAAFDQQNRTSSNSQSEQQAQNKDSKSFKMNISIDVPNSFSIFSPFIKLKNWIISKKKVFIQVGSTCIALALIITLAVAATAYMNNLSVKTDAEAITAAEEAIAAAEVAEAAADAAAAEVVETGVDYNLTNSELTNYGEAVAADEGFGPAEEAVAAAKAANAADLAASNTYNSDVGNNSVEVAKNSKKSTLAPDKVLITKAVREFEAVLSLSGIIGVKEIVQKCYTDINSNKEYCLYLDYSARIFDANYAYEMNTEPNEFFAEQLFLERTFVNYYLPMNILDMDEVNKHLMDSYYAILPVLKKQFSQ